MGTTAAMDVPLTLTISFSSSMAWKAGYSDLMAPSRPSGSKSRRADGYKLSPRMEVVTGG
jgi:hypothetical protein